MMRAFGRKVLVLLALAAAVTAIAHIPTTTLRGVNYEVREESLPLYVKALDFVDRDVNYRRLASQITGAASTDAQKLDAVFAWTRANVRDVPAGFPVIDDHVWHIIIRGYGADDQKADVFTTLLHYAGVPAYWIFIGPRPELALSLVLVSGAWRPVDVANGVTFRTPDKALATVNELASAPARLAAQGPPTYAELPYAQFFVAFQAPVPPEVTRAEMQMMGPRLWQTLRSAAGRPRREWDIRPASRVAAK